MRGGGINPSPRPKAQGRQWIYKSESKNKADTPDSKFFIISGPRFSEMKSFSSTCFRCRFHRRSLGQYREARTGINHGQKVDAVCKNTCHTCVGAIHPVRLTKREREREREKINFLLTLEVLHLLSVLIRLPAQLLSSNPTIFLAPLNVSVAAPCKHPSSDLTKAHWLGADVDLDFLSHRLRTDWFVAVAAAVKMTSNLMQAMLRPCRRHDYHCCCYYCCRHVLWRCLSAETTACLLKLMVASMFDCVQRTSVARATPPTAATTTTVNSGFRPRKDMVPSSDHSGVSLVRPARTRTTLRREAVGAAAAWGHS